MCLFSLEVTIQYSAKLQTCRKDLKYLNNAESVRRRGHSTAGFLDWPASCASVSGRTGQTTTGYADDPESLPLARRRFLPDLDRPNSCSTLLSCILLLSLATADPTESNVSSGGVTRGLLFLYEVSVPSRDCYSLSFFLPTRFLMHCDLKIQGPHFSS